MTHSDLKTIEPSRHPERYKSHKYWGRKPYNVVKQYIENFTDKGEVVLDPFCGSGVSLIESAATGRNSIGCDINPAATFITEQVSKKNVDVLKLESKLTEVVNNLRNEIDVYDANCSCGRDAKIISIVWEDDDHLKVYYDCSSCGRKATDPSEITYKTEIEPCNEFTFPDWDLPSNADVKSTKDLFTDRNKIVLNKLYEQIQNIDDPDIRDLGTYTFTSNLPMVSKLIPVHEKRLDRGVLPSGVWGFKRFWVPEMRMENNVLYYFEKRIERTIKTKTETNNLFPDSNTNIEIYNKSLSDATEIEDRTVDYIFTDPPFGNSVDYLGLSTIWNCWLVEENELPQKSEFTVDEFSKDMKEVFNKCNNILKENGKMTVAFQNKDFEIWRTLLESIISSGFELSSMVYQPIATRSFTQETRYGNIDGHFLHTFSKQQSTPATTSTDDMVKEKVISKLDSTIGDSGATINEIYREVIPFIVNNGYLDKVDDIAKNMDDLLQERYEKHNEETVEQGHEGAKKVKKTMWVKKDFNKQEAINKQISEKLHEFDSLKNAKKEIANDIIVQYHGSEATQTFEQVKLKKEIESEIENQWRS